MLDLIIVDGKGMRTNFLCILFTVGLNYFCSMFMPSISVIGILKVANEKSQFETVQLVSDFIENNVFVSIATLEVGLISIVETFLLSIATLRITSLNLFYFISIGIIHVSLLFSAAQIKSTLIEYILFLFPFIIVNYSSILPICVTAIHIYTTRIKAMEEAGNDRAYMIAHKRMSIWSLGRSRRARRLHHLYPLGLWEASHGAEERARDKIIIFQNIIITHLIFIFIVMNILNYLT
ncbi:hypothetical protein ACJX0J_020611, partial [Zea mays]